MQTVPTPELQIAEPLVMSSSGAKEKALSQLCAALFRPVDIAFLVFFRIVFGAIMLWEVYRYFTHGWITKYFVEPALTFSYYGFSWVKPWPGRGMYIHFLLLGVAAACMMVGFLYRFAAPVFFVAFTYFFLLDQTRYLNHIYLVCLISFLMCFLPAERAFSVDALLRRKIRSDVVPTWTLWLLRAQVGIPYFYGGIAKLNSDWIHGGEPMRTWLHPFTAALGLENTLKGEVFVYFFVIGGLLLDLLVVPLLLWRRTRLFALAAAIAFNLINSVIFDIGIFPWLMLGTLLLFFPPDLMRRFARAFTSPGEGMAHAPSSRLEESTSCASLSRSQKLVAGLLAGYLGIQLLLPLRHYLYPGNVSWTEEGHNFSWHMKLRTKAGEAVFTVADPATGRTWTIKPEDYVKPHQLRMITKPELVLQFCRYLEDEKRREGYDDVEVRAYVMVSLNGRAPQLLVDPNLDLTRKEASLLPASWIVPLTTPLERKQPTNRALHELVAE